MADLFRMNDFTSFVRRFHNYTSSFSVFILISHIICLLCSNRCVIELTSWGSPSKAHPASSIPRLDGAHFCNNQARNNPEPRRIRTLSTGLASPRRTVNVCFQFSIGSHRNEDGTVRGRLDASRLTGVAFA